jgi:hypothetical protein
VSVSTVLYPRWPPLLKIQISSNGHLGTFWLKIEQFWPFEEISIFSNGGHLGYRTVLMDTILKGLYLYFKNYLEIDVKFIAKMCSISRSTYPAILK